MNKYFNFESLKAFIFGFLFLLNLLPIVAPILDYLGEKNFSSFIYWLYQFFCHQKASRSFFICNNQCGWCARCMFIWFGLLVTCGLSFYVINLKSYYSGLSITKAMFLMIPLVLDGGIQLIAMIIGILTNSQPFYESNNTLRAITGSLFGIGLGLFLFPRMKTL